MLENENNLNHSNYPNDPNYSMRYSNGFPDFSVSIFSDLFKTSNFFEAYVTMEEREKAEAEDLRNLIHKAKLVGITINERAIVNCKRSGVSYGSIKRDLEQMIKELEGVYKKKWEMEKSVKEGEECKKEELYRGRWESC